MLNDHTPYERVVLSKVPIEDLPARRRADMIRNALDKLDPEVLVVCGYGICGMPAVLSWARDKVPVVLLSDSNVYDRTRTWWKERAKHHIVNQCGAVLVAGRSQRAYIRSLGVSDDTIFEGYDVVDNAHFQTGASRARMNERELRRSLRLPDRFFLTCARFLKRKNLSRLLRAYASYLQHFPGSEWGLVIVG